jgi:hypothetical protein
MNRKIPRFKLEYLQRLFHKNQLRHSEPESR